MTVLSAPAPLPIPQAGLDHVLRAWIGRGELLGVLGQLASEEVPRDWSPQDTRLRADLMAFHKVAPELARLPSSVAVWMDLLPAQSRKRVTVTEAPTSATHWVPTMRRFGWPPTSFINRHRDRVADELMSSVLSWVVGQSLGLAERTCPLDRSLADSVAAQLQVFEELRAVGLIRDSSAQEPRAVDLSAIQLEGAVWKRLALVARLLLRTHDPSVLAQELLEPSPELRPTFFQLGVLGSVLHHLQQHAVEVRSQGPLSYVTGSEQFHIDFQGRTWHLWSEAAGAWARYAAPSMYRTVSTALRSRTNPLSPDILLVLPGVAAFVIECKYSSDPDYVGRRGLAQTALYMLELQDVAPKLVQGYVVAPAGVVRSSTSEATPIGSLGIAGAENIGSLALSFMASASAFAD